MKLKINDRVAFQHVARGSKIQAGTVIEVSRIGKISTYVIRGDKCGCIYPCLTTNQRPIGQIYKKIS